MTVKKNTPAQGPKKATSKKKDSAQVPSGIKAGAATAKIAVAKKTSPKASGNKSSNASGGVSGNVSGKTSAKGAVLKAGHQAAAATRRQASVPKKQRKGRKKKSLLRSKPFIFALLTVLLLSAGTVYWLFSTSALHGPRGSSAFVEAIEKNKRQEALQKPEGQGQQAKGQQPAGETVENTQNASSGNISSAVLGTSSGPGSTQGASQEYESSFGTVLEQSTRQIDSAMLKMLEGQGLSAKNIKILNVEQRARTGGSYHFQRLQFELPQALSYSESPASFGQELAAALANLSVGAELATVSPTHYVVSVNGIVTHELFLLFLKPGQLGPTLTIPSGEAKLAIVIDDVGGNMSAPNALVALNFPVTFAIWPRSSHAKESAELGHSYGLEIMIHQPMEPMDYPKNKPGPGAVFNKMSNQEIAAIVETNIPLVPYAVGLNNHMGSRFTQNRVGLEAVLGTLEGKNLFVLDSVTHGSTIFYDLALEKGFAAQKRDIFLDDVRNKNAILHQLNAAAHLAHTQGYAIAIGHPAPETLEALKEWQSTRDMEVELVRVQDLLKYKRN